MSWLLQGAAAPSTETALLAQRAALTERYRAFLQTLWVEGAVPLRLLHLCQLRVAAIHDAVPVWDPVPLPPLETPLEDLLLEVLRRGPATADRVLFSESEWIALQVTELMPHGPHQISDAQIAALRTELGNRGSIAMLTALAFFDVNTRLGLSLGLSLGLQSELQT